MDRTELVADVFLRAGAELDDHLSAEDVGELSRQHACQHVMLCMRHPLLAGLVITIAPLRRGNELPR